MISDYSFICFGEDLGDTRFSRFQIMKQLAKENKILYVESIGVRSPQVSSRDIRRIVTKIRLWFRGCWKLEHNLFILSPVSIPFLRSAVFRKMNKLLLLIQIKYWKRKLGLKKVILWIGLPTGGPLVDQLDECLVVYHCADKLVAYVPPEDQQVITHLHERLLAIADVVLTPSEVFCEELRKQSSNCHYLPHGVDYEHFSKAQDPNLQVPEDISRIPNPIIGFFGTINEHWIDFSLLRDVVKLRLEWSFVLIGPFYHSLQTEKIMEQENIHLLGPRPYSELPAYAKAFSACIIPKKQSSLTEASSPLKLREYLATGKPVVSTLRPPLELRDIVVIAMTPTEFVIALERVFSDTPDQRAMRMAAVSNGTWGNRVEILSQILIEALGEHTGE